MSAPGTPLHVAVLALSIRAVMRLIAAGANLEAPLGPSSATPLEVADGIESYIPPTSPPVGLFLGRQEIVHLLAQAGANTGNVPDFEPLGYELDEANATVFESKSKVPSSIPSYLM